MTIVKYVVVGTFIIGLLGGGIFLFLNLGNSENAEAGTHPKGEMDEVGDNTYKDLQSNTNATAIDFSAYLNTEEMELLTNRDFIRDTTRKEYTSVKWNLDNHDHLTLEVTNNKSTYSLEVFDHNGTRVLIFGNISDETFIVDKLDLVANHEYTYLVRNTAGELYAGNFKFKL